ncbi:MAG: VOC family protein [Acidimicrobiia bacterium]
MNHAVLYVRDAQAHRRFYEDVLGFTTVIDGPGPFVFMRAPASTNHHDIAFFTIGAGAAPSDAGQRTVGMYHLAWEVATLDELAAMRERLSAAGALIGASDHHCNKSLYCRDPDGLEFEVMWLTPASEWGDDESAAIVRPLDLEGDLARYGGSTTTFGHRADDREETG